MATLDWVRLALSLVGAGVYVLVGLRVGKRRVSRQSGWALQAFQLWWFGLAAFTVFGALLRTTNMLPQGGGLLTFRVYLLHLFFLVVLAAVAGLLYYLLYVYSGKNWVAWPVLAYTFLAGAWLMTVINQAHPIGYGEGCPGGGWCYERDYAGTITGSLLTLSLVGPMLLATLAYLALYFRVENRVQRRRIALVASGLGLWFTSSLVAAFWRGDFVDSAGKVARITLNQSPYWSQVASPLISLGAALLVLWAFSLEENGAGTAA